MNRIKDVLEEKRIKQKWVAKRLGKSYNMVNSYTQNRQQPRFEVLFNIARILNVEAKYILTAINNNTNTNNNNSNNSKILIRK
ncbi:helix-turn-helix domain-containing protein [Flavobacterium qiangtangense]|uniref:Helix-turn-helix domain-containing protein n=1 Tax=Flavobacterium qiangtangense TaxID=1442595 RepID=A0ABW1PRS4_9FLAO